jgi:hypothetical protein
MSPFAYRGSGHIWKAICIDRVFGTHPEGHLEVVFVNNVLNVACKFMLYKYMLYACIYLYIYMFLLMGHKYVFTYIHMYIYFFFFLVFLKAIPSTHMANLRKCLLRLGSKPTPPRLRVERHGLTMEN